MFAEKLDFLMKLTGTRNSALGRAAHVDASTVSRLRVGKRELPKSQNFLPLMCAYFARSIAPGYQAQSAADAICPGRSWPDDPERAAALIHAWLTEEKPAGNRSIERLVSRMANFTVKATPFPEAPAPLPSVSESDTFYFGNVGKRAAVVRFLSAVIAAEQPRMLLLYSDEGMDWLNEDETFAHQWAGLMLAAIQKGNRIRIIHTVGRTLEEMMEALNKWLGVYMTGAVEPYYCPRLRDGINRRTLFIAPGLAAVTAASVGGDTAHTLNLYLSDGKALDALEAEFQRYLALCLPLMCILTSERARDAGNLLQELMKAEGDEVSAQAAPSLYTMPDWVAHSLCDRWGNPSLLEAREVALTAFRNHIEHASFYEVLTLPNPPAHAPAAGLPFSLTAAPSMRYAPAEYAAHLEGVLQTLERYENYHVVLQDAPFLPSNMALYHKTNRGTVIVRTDGDPILFAINTDSMNAAFSEYLARMLTGAKTPENRRRAVQRLRKAQAPWAKVTPE